MENLDQLQTEWAIINASRELLSIVKENPNIRYEDAFKFAKQIAPEILLNSDIGVKKRSRLEKLYDRYTQEALAKSREQNKKILPEEIISARIDEIGRLLSLFTQEDNDPESFKKEMSDLKSLLKPDFDNFLSLERVTEGQAILNDSFLHRADKICIGNHLGKFNTYLNKENRTVFRVAVLHPNPSEAITGADIIYEQYDETTEKVRIAAIQYKIWEDGVLYFSQAGNLTDQLRKMKECFCDDALCDEEKNDSGNNHRAYRLPYCCAFLRPTDKIQNPDKLVSTGYHLPVCKIGIVKTEGYKSATIKLENIKHTAVKANTFEELFNNYMLGSRWLDKKTLEILYQKSKVLEPFKKIILYAQNVLLNEEDDPF